MAKNIKYVSVELTPKEKKILIDAKKLIGTRGLSTFLRDAGLARAKNILKNNDETWTDQ